MSKLAEKFSTFPQTASSLEGLTPKVAYFDKNIQGLEVQPGIENIAFQFLRSLQQVFLSEKFFGTSELLNAARSAQFLESALKAQNEKSPSSTFYFMQKYFLGLMESVIPALKEDVDRKWALMQPETRARIEASEMPYGHGDFEIFLKKMEDLRSALQNLKIPFAVKVSGGARYLFAQVA